MSIDSTIKCSTCKHWRGHKDSAWGDCQWVVGTLECRLFQCVSCNDYKFRVPFDPHEAKYYDHSHKFKKLYQSALSKPLPEGVRVAVSKERDTKFNEEGHPKVCVVKYSHVQTANGFKCAYYERK